MAGSAAWPDCSAMRQYSPTMSAVLSNVIVTPSFRTTSILVTRSAVIPARTCSSSFSSGVVAGGAARKYTALSTTKTAANAAVSFQLLFMLLPPQEPRDDAEGNPEAREPETHHPLEMVQSLARHLQRFHYDLLRLDIQELALHQPAEMVHHVLALDRLKHVR